MSESFYVIILHNHAANFYFKHSRNQLCKSSVIESKTSK